jgi:hypothetical protein
MKRMNALLHGESMKPETFQNIFLRPDISCESDTRLPSNVKVEEEEEKEGQTFELSVNESWLQIFRKAKQKLLAEQSEQQLSTKNHLYDNHRERVQNKWWNNTKSKGIHSKGAKKGVSPIASKTATELNTEFKQRTIEKDKKREELEASLSAQFDEELSRTSACFYPAMPVRATTVLKQVQARDEEVVAVINTKTKGKKNSTSVKKSFSSKNHSNGGGGGGAFQSSELSKRYEAIVWGNVFDGSTTADCLFVRSAIIRKDLLHRYNEKADIIPRTIVVESRQDVIDAIRNNSNADGDGDGDGDNDENDCSNVWVVKPPDSSNAFGITFFHSSNVEQKSMSMFPSTASSSGSSSLSSSLSSSPTGTRKTKYVMQRYVRPYITEVLNNCKFHLRQMILLVGGSLNSLDLWIYHDIRVLVATHPWSSKDEDWDDVYCHVTNGSVNRSAAKYELNGSQNRSLEDVFPVKSPTDSTLDPKALRLQMTEGLITVMKSVHVNAKKSTFMSLPGTYELFGVDWAIDNNGKCWLLEINPEPSMKLYLNLSRKDMIRSGPFADDGLPDGWRKIWGSQMMDAMKRLRRNRR